MTFGIVLLYKYRCMKFLIGYMVFSSASLLGVLGDYMAGIAVEIYRIPIDVVSYHLLLYNFAVVGVTAIFYQKGVPSRITQTYLVFTSVILAWHLSHFDDWTAWTLLVMLAFYDLCAVLTPCGPLKALVNLMSQEDSPDMPGLLYEAKLPAGTQKPGAKSKNTSRSSSTAARQESEVENKDVDRDSNDGNEGTQESEDNEPVNEEASITITETSRIPADSLVSPLTIGPRATLPMAIAKIYRLPLTSRYERPSSASSTRRKGRRKPREKTMSTSNINQSPLLADTSPEEFYQREFTRLELIADVEVQFPRNGGRVEKVGGPRNRDCKYLVYGKDGDLRRTLVVDRNGKVFEVSDEDDDDESVYDEAPSIRLGLGDFIFYSVMVAKAAMYSFTTFAACMLVILSGLGGTLVLLSVYHSALPALPISIFLGVIFYLLTKVLIEPWIEVIMTSPIYV
eukprot:CAMPEP_0197234578 /NCGR_PEP_ID=MMETSP1429-20130617/2295_1 /TAXON_ID=49237 /ORGANISM="Chaetoceros  sp., Strain UNC1202" /LENGTH=453 /DNA_ID=CAMNT_0042693023 /DNA_START=117 /DNA_END=1478 /DNA_ORIENTATION=-